jgi:hypothetical protein
MNAPKQTVILFLDSAPTRENLEARTIFREHNILVITFLPHLTHTLRPVGVAWPMRHRPGGSRASPVIRFGICGSLELHPTSPFFWGGTRRT